ncbi:MAG: hypothetical protein ACOZEN_06815 [Thermodesulfobacteriota bacterium]
MAVEMCADKVLSIFVKPEDKTLAATPTIFMWRAPFAGRVIGCYASDETGVAADATNYMTLTLTNTDADGTGTTSMGTHVGTAAVAAGVPKAFTLSTTAASIEFDAGDIIKLVKTEAGTGQDFTDVRFQLDVVSGKS